MDAASEARALRALETGTYQGEFISYATPAQLFATFPPKRWEVVGMVQAIGPTSLRALARALGRDVKRVHEDVAVLLAEGVLERDDNRKLFVPYATIHVSFDLMAKAA